MLDTVAIQVQHARPPKSLERVHRWHDQRRGITWQQGYVQNFRVRYFAPERLLQATGSLPKLLLGNNVENLDRAGVEDAIGLLGETVGFHPSTARVFRLDLAATMKMKRPASYYLNLLGPRSRFEQIIHVGKSMNYFNKSRAVLIYDKAPEAGIPANLLRFEVQFKKRLRRQLGWYVVLSDLCEEKRYVQLVSRWQDEYSKTPKVKQHILHCPTGVRDLDRQLAQVSLPSFGGASAVEHMLDECGTASGLRSRLRKRVRALAATGNHPEDNALLAELDEAVRQAANYART